MQKRQAQLEQLVAGTQKNLPATSTVDVNGQELKQADIVAKLQSWIPLFQQVDATKAPARSAQQALQAAGSEMNDFVVHYRQALRQVFGKSSPLLDDFGLATVQRKTPTAETLVLAKARRAATRKARNTLGKVARKAIKGAPVTTVTVPTSGVPQAQSFSPQVVNPATSASEPTLSEQTLGPATVPATSPASK
jgi:hypothetical protein